MKASWHREPEQDAAEAGGSMAVERPWWHRLWTTPLSDLLRGRMSCRLDVRAIVEASDLPEAVRGRILDTVKRTRLSRREKAGIAGELVAHFADGLEAGVPEGEMLSGFGDVRTAAKLMRRAKLRCRAWPRRAMRRTGQALAVLAVVYVVAAIYYAAGRPKVTVDYLARMNAAVQAVPEEDRAWPVYREALLGLDRAALRKLLKMEGIEPGGEAWDEAVRFVEDNEAALATARRAAAMGSLGVVLRTSIAAEDRALWPDEYAAQEGAEPFGGSLGLDSPETLLVAVRAPHLMELRNLHRLFAIDAARALEQGDGERVTADVEAMLGSARQVAAEQMLTGQLIARAAVMEASDSTAELLRSRPELLTDAGLRRLAHAFAAADVLSGIRLAGERLWFEDLLQRIYTDDGRGDGHLVPGAIGLMQLTTDPGPGVPSDRPAAQLAMSPLVNAVVASRRDMKACYDRIMDRYEALFAKPYWEVRRSGLVGDEILSSMSFLQEVRYLMVATSAPALDRVYQRQEDAVARRDGLLVALALEAHRRRHRDWPGALEELVPDLLPEVPRDRFTGEPLRYRVDGGEVVVYSVGPDLDDDGGVLPAAPAAPDPDRSPAERFREINKRAGVSSDETPDGDWILWHSAPAPGFL